MESLRTVRGNTYEKTRVQLDGTRYENCRFIGCTLAWDGGITQLSSCFIAPDTQWAFGPRVMMILNPLAQMGWSLHFGKIDATSEAIRFPS